MAEHKFRKRNGWLLVVFFACVAVFFATFPHVESVSYSNGQSGLEPVSLGLLLIFDGALGIITLLLYLVDYKEYKIIGKKYILKTSKVHLNWKEVKE